MGAATQRDERDAAQPAGTRQPRWGTARESCGSSGSAQAGGSLFSRAEAEQRGPRLTKDLVAREAGAQLRIRGSELSRSACIVSKFIQPWL